MRKKLLVFWALLGLVLIGPTAVATSPPEVDPSDDAYHYEYFRDGRHDAFYIEWWYFSLFADDFQAIFSYPLFNPDNIRGTGLAGVAAVAYTAGGIVSATDWFSPDLFYASYEKADVRIPNRHPFPNYINVNEDGTYHIAGTIQSENHDLSWDLTYVPQTNPWFAREREKVGLFRWEQMSWLVYMPGAYVTGEVVIDGVTYEVYEVSGYHDHNWGEWISTNALWNWAQYFEPAEEPGEQGESGKPALAFEVGDFRSKPVGVVSIEFDGTRTVFEKEKGEYIVFHTRWGYDWENHKRFPVKTWLYAENGTHKLVISLRTIRTEPVLSPLKLPSFLPEVILYEQTAYYTGRLWEKNEDGQWELLVLFSGNGFKEYTALLW